MQDNFINSRPVKVLAISASPRNPSNSEVFLQEALGVLPTLRIQTDVTVYHFRGKNFRPCIACLQCFKNGGMCILQDDFESLRQLWLAADCIIYSLPVYVVGIPGVLKCFLDRLHNATVIIILLILPGI